MYHVEVCIEEIHDFLISRAKNRSTCGWPELFRICDPFKSEITQGNKSYETEVFRMLTTAACKICDPSIAIYSALFDPPKRGFLSNMHLRNRGFYTIVPPGVTEHDMIKGKKYSIIGLKLAEEERKIVYKHASSIP